MNGNGININNNINFNGSDNKYNNIEINNYNIIERTNVEIPPDEVINSILNPNFL